MGVGSGARGTLIGAMAQATKMEKKELSALMTHFTAIAKRQGSPNTITRSEFQEALALAGIVESDSEILDRLYTMFDTTGSDSINFREFIVGVSPLVSGEVKEKLVFRCVCVCVCVCATIVSFICGIAVSLVPFFWSCLSVFVGGCAADFICCVCQ